MEDFLDTYIIRIYRRSEGDAPLVGMVEKAGAEGKASFRSPDELLGLLMGRPRGGRTERRKAARLRLKLPVKIKGKSPLGKAFTELAQTENLSSSGAYLPFKNPVGVDEGLNMVVDPGRSALKLKARVVRVRKGRSRNYIAIRFEKSA